MSETQDEDELVNRRMQDLVANVSDISDNDVHLLRLGHHFRLSPELKAIVGRDNEENRCLEIRSEGHDLFEPDEVPGPTMLARGPVGREERELLGRLLAHFCREHIEGQPLRVLQRQGFSQTTFSVKEPADEEQVEQWRL